MSLVAVDSDTGFLRPKQLTHGPGRDLNPRFAPDGSTIVFERRLGSGSDLYAVRPDGSGLRLLVGWPGREASPDFSPDGRWIVFSSDLTGRFQLYVMPAEGGPARRLTRSAGDDTRPVWSPDGRWIAFSSNRDDDNDVFLIDPAGEHERKLTHNASEDLVEDWQPHRDARAPVVRALPSSVGRGATAPLRFTVRDRSRRVRISVELQLLYKDSVTTISGSGSAGLVAPGPRVRTLRVSVYSFDEPEGERPSRGRFCITAVDPWGNVSRESCAPLRFT